MQSRTVRVGTLLSLIVLTSAVIASAQSQLVPLVTDKTPLALSETFGLTALSRVNDAQDYAFVGNGNSALFLRRAGAPAPVRIYQAGEEVPGFTGSRGDPVSGLQLNAAGVVAYRVDFALPTGELQGAIFTFNGASSARAMIVSGVDKVPGMGGTAFGHGISLLGLNDGGGIAFSAPLGNDQATPQTTLFFIAPSGTPQRMVGLGDPAPDTPGNFAAITAISFNNIGEVLFSGRTTSGGLGLFVASASSGVRKVALVSDEVGPAQNPPAGILNNVGEVAFASPDGSIWVHSAATGKRLVIPAKTPVLGRWFDWPGQPKAFNDAGEIVFTAVDGPEGTVPPYMDFGMFRFHPGQPDTIETVAHRRQLIANDSQLRNFIDFSSVSINAAGTVGFRATIGWGVGSNRSYGLFTQSGSSLAATLVLGGQSTTLAGGGTYSLSASTLTRTLNSGELFFWADVVGGDAYYGEFLVSETITRVLMSTADELPSGSTVLLRTGRLGAAGDFVGFFAQRAGGRLSIAVHDIGNLSTAVVLTEGDSVAALGNWRIRFNTRNTVFLNTRGSVALAVSVMSQTFTGTAVLLKKPGEAWKKVASTGDPVPGQGTTFNNVRLPGAIPVPLNNADQVVFSGDYWTTSVGTGVFVGTVDSSPVKVAATGDTLADGSTFGASFASANSCSINNADPAQVAFVGNATLGGVTRQGIYIGVPGSSPVKVAGEGDPAPWPGTWIAGTGLPSFNSNGKVAFLAGFEADGTAAPDVPVGAILIGSTSSSLIVVATDKTPLAGESISDTAENDVSINDRDDVVFRVDLTGGPADSGIFVRRGATGTIETLVLQGQTAPGTNGGTFVKLLRGTANIAERLQLEDTGQLAFQTRFQDSDGVKAGAWRVKVDGTIEPILVRGDVASEFGGGIAVNSRTSGGWNSEGRYPVWARISGGTFTDGIFLSVPAAGTTTPEGSDVAVQPVDETTGTKPVSLTFNSVAQAGQTTVTTSAAGPSTPTAFTLGNPPVFYDIKTTATFAGPITICIDISSVGFPAGGATRLLHYEHGAWVDVTMTVSSTEVCGAVNSLSPFTVAKVPAITFDVAVTPTVLWPANNKMVSITANIAVSQPGAPSPRVELVSITSNERLVSGDVQQAAFGTDCRGFLLRATRLGAGNGRTYAITYRATDFVGASATRTATVFVPHDQGKK